MKRKNGNSDTSPRPLKGKISKFLLNLGGILKFISSFSFFPKISFKQRIYSPLGVGGFCLLFLLSPTDTSNACGPTNRSFQGYTFINPDIFNLRESDAPFLMSFTDLYNQYFKNETEQKQLDNLTEWQDRFCGLVTKEDLEFIIYKASIADLELLRTAAESKKMSAPARLANNSFADYVMDKKCVETVDYLIFAKRCEPYVTQNDAWSDVKKDYSAMRRLVTQGRKELMRTKSPYVRLRYAYQIVRMAHYARDYQLALDMYDFAIPKVDRQLSRMEESFLPYWILGHKAGAMMALGQNVEASYLFSLIFENCPSKEHSAFQSFSIKTEEEWKACLLLCKNDRERANLYAIRGNLANAKAVKEMQAIYNLDPMNAHLEVLLLKEMKKLEKNLLGLAFNDKAKQNKRNYGIPKPYMEDYLIEMQAFVRQVRADGKVPQLQLWHLAEGYLELLAGDFYAANKTFEEVGRLVEQEDLKKQLGTFQTVLKINAYRNINDNVENEIFTVLKENEAYKKYPDFPDFLRDKLSFLYKKSQEPGKRFLVKYPFNDLKPHPREDILRSLMLLATKQNPSRYEKMLLSDHEGESLVYELLDIQATTLMREYQLEAAFELYKEIPRTEWSKFGVFQPFKQHFDECVHCYQAADSSAMYNKGEMLEKMLDFEYKARGELDNNAPYFYQLGLAFYNTSYFGYSWGAMDYFRSGATWTRLHKDKDDIYPYPQFPYGNIEHTDVTKALYYFEKTKLLSLNPELTARAAFMAAKCEQKMYFMSKQYKREPCCNQIPKLPDSYLVNFKMLKEKLSDTEFYEQMIEECYYFQVYAEQ